MHHDIHQNASLTFPYLQMNALATIVACYGLLGVALRDAPGGKIIGFLPEGAPVQILYRRETINGVAWLEVRNVLNRVGWLPVSFLTIKL